MMEMHRYDAYPEEIAPRSPVGQRHGLVQSRLRTPPRPKKDIHPTRRES